ncbi:MAG: ATP-binding cassette domain-containing protein [Clostridia bacterium]|nr:ATP-binding cassette domain-containing protein [Clostridia bacterium]
MQKEIKNDPSALALHKKQAKAYQLDENIAVYFDHFSVIFDENTKVETKVLLDVDVKLEKGKIYFVIGDSGSGKTTLVNHLNGLIKSKHGNIFIESSKIIGEKRKISKVKKLRKSVGMVFQFPEYQLFKDTILKDVMFGPVNLGVKKEKARRLAEKYLTQMGLGKEYFQRSPFELSGGQKRRAAIAGILAMEPNVFVFDEPTAGLDPVGTQEMLNIINSLHEQGKTVIVITHDMNHVLSLADKVLVLGEQKLLAFDEPYNIFYSDVINKTSIIKPHIIQMIDKLIAKDEKFKKLLELKPRTRTELALCISKVIGGGSHVQ